MATFFKRWLVKIPQESTGELMQRAEVVSTDEPSKEQLERWFQSQNYIERGCAAWKGYKLEVLINDPHPYVRSCVADSYFGLDKLATDTNNCVTEEVQRMLDLARLTLEEWVNKSPERCALPENRANAPCCCPCCKMKFKLAGAKFCPYCGSLIEDVKE